MQRVISSIFVVVALGFFTVAVAQEVSEGDKPFFGLIPSSGLLPLILTALSVAWMTWCDSIVSSKLLRNLLCRNKL